MTDNAPETRLVDIKGRTVVVKQLKDAQLLLLGRDAKKLDDPTLDAAAKMELASNVLDMFESAIAPVDRAYVMGLARVGEIELKDFLEFLTVFNDAEEPETKPAVRRGRPRKAVK